MNLNRSQKFVRAEVWQVLIYNEKTKHPNFPDASGKLQRVSAIFKIKEVKPC